MGINPLNISQIRKEDTDPHFVVFNFFNKYNIKN